ncbi:MAG: hypothetical protein HYU34_03860 [Candidatus Omnitrophica bacterium]|nr:hypothetical protein [Candidatus Omnitrophota bacterium]
METSPVFLNQEASLRKKIKNYQGLAQELKHHLSKHPHDWGKFQSEFNIELNGVFRDIMNFEKQSLAKGDEESVYKLRRIFVNHLRKDFLYGDYIVWSLKKPYGYAGDFKIIDDIYRNDPQTQGFDRLFDNYALMSAIAVAIRNRKEDVKKFMITLYEDHPSEKLRIMDIASGPCRELKEFFASTGAASSSVMFDCYDQDGNAIQYAKELLGSFAQVLNFYEENVIKIALKKKIEPEMQSRYDVIYSTGLFDYLDHRLATRLVHNLRQFLRVDGRMFIANVREKYQNPSVHFLEWVGDWNLIYRTEEEFVRIFLDAGFNADEIQVASEQQGILQYVTASKT